MSGSALRWLTTLICLMAIESGCAQFDRFIHDPNDISTQQKQRTAETLEEFETKRDFAQLQAANARWREGNMPECCQVLEHLITRNPKHYEGRLLLAQVLLSQEKFEPALGHLEKLTEDRDDDARTQHAIALALEALGRESEALAHRQRAAEIEPENPGYVASCELAAQTFPEQQASCGAEADDESPIATVAATTATTGAVQTAEHLTPAERKERDLDPRLIEAGRAFTAGQHEQAEALLVQALAAAPDDQRLAVRSAVLALRHEQPAIAVRLLQPLADRFTDSLVIQRTLGTACYRNHDYETAERVLKQVLSLDNSDALAYLLMGCTLEKSGKSALAKSYFDQAARLDPRFSTAR